MEGLTEIPVEHFIASVQTQAPTAPITGDTSINQIVLLVVIALVIGLIYLNWVKKKESKTEEAEVL